LELPEGDTETAELVMANQVMTDLCTGSFDV